jgi:hypothetical protein
MKTVIEYSKTEIKKHEAEPKRIEIRFLEVNFVSIDGKRTNAVPLKKGDTWAIIENGQLRFNTTLKFEE